MEVIDEATGHQSCKKRLAYANKEAQKRTSFLVLNCFYLFYDVASMLVLVALMTKQNQHSN